MLETIYGSAIVPDMRDEDVRRVLLDRLNTDCLVDPTTIVVEELGLRSGFVRADVAVVNGCLKGYEIKSDSDTLRRLARQSHVYCKVFDTMTLVVGESHFRAAESIIPIWWGIEIAVWNSAADQLELSPFRAERENCDVEASELVQLLWRDEALDILLRFDAHLGVRNKPRKYVWQALVDTLELSVLKSIVRDTLKRRKGWRVVAGQTQYGVTSQPCAKSSDYPSPLFRPRIRRYSNRPN
jgi:hypothetical protein